jgi:prepilin peptidase CpaA
LTLTLILLIAVLYDYRTRKIPNYLIITGMIAAFAYHGLTEGYQALWFGFKGFMVGLMVLFLPFGMGWLGGGDVKLLGMIGAFKGSLFVLGSFVFMALWGGLIAAAYLLSKGRLKETLKKMLSSLLLAPLGIASLSTIESNDDPDTFPYGLAIALGAVTSYFSGWW